MKITDEEVLALYDRLRASPLAKTRFPLRIVPYTDRFAMVDWLNRTATIGRNLIDLMPSKGALAAVLGHELAHNDPVDDLIAGHSRHLIEIMADQEGLRLAVKAGEAEMCDGEKAISALVEWELTQQGFVRPAANLRHQEMERVCDLTR